MRMIRVYLFIFDTHNLIVSRFDETTFEYDFVLNYVKRMKHFRRQEETMES